MRNKAFRNYKRLVKGTRRIKEDRAQHGADHSCECFAPIGKGAAFARFADTPKTCSNPGHYCGNIRKLEGPTLQELKGPKIQDWE